jgi:hypothetical protein
MAIRTYNELVNVISKIPSERLRQLIAYCKLELAIRDQKTNNENLPDNQQDDFS